jgi:hypothetical protein
MSDEIATLTREYPSVWSRPVIRGVDIRVFRLRYFRRCLSCTYCGDQCCDHGVDVDVENAERLSALGSDFESFVGAPQSEWFDLETIADEEFPSRRYRRTRTRNGKCTFHAEAGRGCKIHAWCLEKGIDYHPLKPMVSVLFPLTFEQGLLMPSNEVIDRTLVCTGEGDTLYNGVRDELAWYFGDSLVEELDRLQAAFRSQQVPPAAGEAGVPATR